MEQNFARLDRVKEYYGKTLKTNRDLKTSACCTIDSITPALWEILKEIHPEVIEKFYGCGSPIPSALAGLTVLDLGSGSGRDCFLLSKLVGPSGRVIGIDMTDEQIAVAQRHVDYHRKKFGFREPNVTFIKGYIEDLRGAGIKDDSIDLVVSNCVVNLSPSKERVFSEIFRVLKPGGELYFSDVFAGRRIPKNLVQNPVFVGECLGGALYTEDFRRLLGGLGCSDHRLTACTRIALKSAELKRATGMIDFYSMTVRAFKLALEDRCEDYGQAAIYLGGVAEFPDAFFLDDHHTFERGRAIPVCGNTAMMLQNTRYGRYFKIIGDMTIHFGLFDCREPASILKSHAITNGPCC